MLGSSTTQMTMGRSRETLRRSFAVRVATLFRSLSPFAMSTIQQESAVLRTFQFLRRMPRDFHGLFLDDEPRRRMRELPRDAPDVELQLVPKLVVLGSILDAEFQLDMNLVVHEAFECRLELFPIVDSQNMKIEPFPIVDSSLPARPFADQRQRLSCVVRDLLTNRGTRLEYFLSALPVPVSLADFESAD